ncbi:ATP-binding protein [Oceanithermus sp.]|uniref:ATP-binding protein n=1 Tax=Oceanithermus sp. TaxID=2268145 RepID=UPI0025DF7C5B|nr:ATP-binding protein [Oceanithermus sp.]
MKQEAIGVVLGSREASPLEFWIGIQGGLVRLDDVVWVEANHGGLKVRYYGMVDRVHKVLEGAQFDSDTFLAAGHLIPTNTAYVAHVTVTRLDPEEYLPPDPGSPVYLARGKPLDAALYYDRMEERLPVGFMKNGEPAYINLAFLDGRQGGHVNISGVSGVAAKTSYALFLLYSLYNARVLEGAASAKTLIFNVKGQDLFYLDKPNRKLTDEDRERYRRLGLDPEPFASVAFFAPPRLAQGQGHVTAASSRGEGVHAYHWSVADFAREGLLPFLFADRGSMSNLGFLIDHVSAKLAALARGQEGPELYVDDWPQGPSGGEVFDALGRARIDSFARLVDYIEAKLLGDEAEGEEAKGDPLWIARQHTGTLQAFIRRLRAAGRNVGHLIRGDAPSNAPDVLGSDAQINVVDIHGLSAQGQMFVVGALLRHVFEAKESGRYRGKVFVVLDELNKYAPREGESPIKDVLLDIAERGRSLGVILIGAQQTASEVERRVVGNAAVRVVGRLDAAEAERPEYRYLPGAFRDRALILPQGTMILHQPEVPVPIAVQFPYPAWATKASEAVEDVSDEALKDELGL